MGYVQDRSRRTVLIFLAPAMVILILISLYPTLYSLYLSFREYNLAKPFIPRVFVGLNNYTELLGAPGLWHALWVTFKLMAITLSAELVLGFSLALLVTQKLPGIALVRTLLMIPMMISPVIAGLLWLFLYFPELGYLNYFLGLAGIPPVSWIASQQAAIYAIAIADIWQWTPFIMMGAAAGLQSLSPEPYEAARIDGNSWLDVLIHVTLPQLKPVLASLLFLRAIDAFKLFDIIYVLTKGGPGDSTETITLFIYREGFTLWRMGMGAAASFVSLIIISVMITLFARTMKERSRV